MVDVQVSTLNWRMDSSYITNAAHFLNQQLRNFLFSRASDAVLEASSEANNCFLGLNIKLFS